jgi:Holliday junction resolvase YEN1
MYVPCTIMFSTWLTAWQAPGEAEAELAALSKLHLVDAIITEDSDAVVFGATTILRL